MRLRTGGNHSPVIQKPHPPISRPLVHNLLPLPPRPTWSQGPAPHFLLFLFCFVFFLHSIPWETLKGYILPPGNTGGTGRAPEISQTPHAGRQGWWWLGGGDIYLFILSCCAPHPPSCCSSLGKMKNGFRQWRTRLATWPPQFNFL